MIIPNVQGERPKTGEITKDSLFYYSQRIHAARQWIMPGYPLVSTEDGEKRLREYLTPQNKEDVEDLKREISIIDLELTLLDALHFTPKLNNATGSWDFRYPKIVDARKDFCMLDKYARIDAIDIYEGNQIVKEHKDGMVNE